MSDRMIHDVPTEKPVARQQVRLGVAEAEQLALAQNVKEHGIRVPLIGYQENGAIVVFDGHRRLDAAKRAGLTTVPMIILERAPTATDRILLQFVINCQRADLTPIEKARAIDDLMRQTKWNASQVAGKLGLSQASISRLLALLVLPADMQARVASGEIPASAAYELAKVGDSTERARLAAEVAGSGLSRDALAGKVRTAKRAAAAGAENTAKRVTAVLGNGNIISVSSPGLTLGRLIELLEELLTKARKARPKGVELDTFLRVLRDEAKGGRNADAA